MKKKFILIFLSVLLASSACAQLAVAKVVGKNASKYKIGFGIFGYYEIPLNEVGNNSIRLELLDLAYFPSNDADDHHSKGYLSFKLGYKNIFSETKTGFYAEPQLGYCRVIGGDGKQAGGIALAGEAGYSLEVGQQSNTLNFGLKYETDMAGSEQTISSVGFRFSFSLDLFRRREY